MSEGCKNGHDPSEIVHWKGKQPRVRCKVCIADAKGGETGTQRHIRLRNERVEDIEDLVRFGATFSEIMERSHYSSWDTMRRALKVAGREDLIERLKLMGDIRVGKNRFTN